MQTLVLEYKYLYLLPGGNKVLPPNWPQFTVTSDSPAKDTEGVTLKAHVGFQGNPKEKTF